ncbi:MAG TPA: hypothetical protein VH042_05300 [Solirubrobacterales bacterium]|jgi:hypothetical protein|nr:hypothetical protein [Solirubrobacterales bacterium]
MNMLKKGPELKLPDFKVPDFALDIYYDLRERHLLPLVAILLVALVALPIVLSGGSSSDASGESKSAAMASPSTVQTSKLVVAKATPGLREYKHRLAGRKAQDPFIQQYAGPEGGEGTTGTGESTGEIPSEGAEGPSTPTESTEPSGATETTPSTEGNGEPPEGGHLQYYSFAIDTRVVPVTSGNDKPNPSVRHNLPEMTMLPSRSVPALTFIGVTKDEKSAVMLVSDKVTGLFGDGVCVVGSEACQLIALEPGIPETVVYGADSRTYRIELLKLRLITTDKLNKAPLGSSKKKSGGSEGSAG